MSIVGHLDAPQRVYSLITHSGMTLAPLLGRLTANELAGAEENLLADFRPWRFAGGVTPSGFRGFIGRQ